VARYSSGSSGSAHCLRCAQETLRRNPHNGNLFVFRGRRGSLIKVLWHDGQGMCLYAKRLERGRLR
jgi:transposase